MVVYKGYVLVMNAIDHPREKKRINTNYCENLLRSTQPLYELLPCFTNNDNPLAYGKLPPAPQGQDEAVYSILDVWLKNVMPACLLYRDGNTKNFFPENIHPIDFTAALRHQKKYVTDWDRDLDTNQIEYVKSNIQYFIDLTKVIFRQQSFCSVCEKFYPMYCCSRCKQTYYCSQTCQHEAWRSHHKKQCKKIQSVRKPPATPDPEMEQLCLDLSVLHFMSLSFL